MRSMIKEFWRQLDDTVHPNDRSVFASNPHTFNLDYPPPAFIGDIDRAPVIILMANGGYDPNPATGTKSEFLDQRDYEEHLDFLRNDNAPIPRRLSTYYTQNEIFNWVREGEAVIVNAVAYRSRKLSQEPGNQRLAELLPSVKVHRQWLYEEALPAAADGKRCIVAHRWSLWKFPRGSEPFKNVYHSKNPVSKTLTPEIKATVDEWLETRTYVA